MAFLARVHVWVSGEILYASDLNTEFNNICNNVLVTPGSSAQGDLYFFNSSIWTRLPAGVSGQFLRTKGSLANPVWNNFIQADFAAVMHSWLQGLSADDHPQYLNLNKASQTLLQDLNVAAGVKIGNIPYPMVLGPWNTSDIVDFAITRGVKYYAAGTVIFNHVTPAEVEIGTITPVTNLTTDSIWMWAAIVVTQVPQTSGKGGPCGFTLRIRRYTTKTITVSIGTPAVVSLTSHGFTAGTPIKFSTTGHLPTGITAGTLYYVIAAGLGANSFEFSTIWGGSAVNTSGSQDGVHSVSYFGTQIYAADIGIAYVVDYAPIMLMGTDIPPGDAGNHIYKLTATPDAEVGGFVGGTNGIVAYIEFEGIARSK